MLALGRLGSRPRVGGAGCARPGPVRRTAVRASARATCCSWPRPSSDSCSWGRRGSASGAPCERIPTLRWRRLWWVAAAWTAPLLLAAPFASQDVWVYVAQGKLVDVRFGGDQPGTRARAPLGMALRRRSALSDRTLPSTGPERWIFLGLFAKVGGRPSVDCRRRMAAGRHRRSGAVRVGRRPGRPPLAASTPPKRWSPAWRTPRCSSSSSPGSTTTPSMISLIVAGVALALAKRPWWALCLAALAVTVKAPAALAVLAIAWWYWRDSWRRRAVRSGGWVRPHARCVAGRPGSPAVATASVGCAPPHRPPWPARSRC